MKLFRTALRILAVVVLYYVITGPGVLMGETPGLYHEYSRDTILGFTRHLVRNGEYYRASVELERLAVFYPSTISIEQYSVSHMFLLMKGHQYRQVAASGNIDSGGPAACVRTLLRSDAMLYASSYQDSAALLVNPGMQCDSTFGAYFWKRRYVASLLGNRPEEASALLETNNLPPDILQKKQLYRDMLSYSEGKLSRTVAPWKALWAGAVPGLGYACAGNRPTGIVAFVMVSVLSALTVASFKTDNEPLGVCFGAVAAFFYSGSIAGGYLEAKRNNRIIRENLRDSLCGDAGFAEDWDRLNNEYGLSLSEK
ncbi:MAG TPA: hypothetical protein PK544_07230 [Spirochaetota bacterium]|nr:hypothetical protein [Spirochaetota bacterium]